LGIQHQAEQAHVGPLDGASEQLGEGGVGAVFMEDGAVAVAAVDGVVAVAAGSGAGMACHGADYAADGAHRQAKCTLPL
jgi:hypothetical protein